MSNNGNGINWSLWLVIGGMVAFVYHGIKALLYFIVFMVEFLTAIIGNKTSKNIVKTRKTSNTTSNSDSTTHDTVTITSSSDNSTNDNINITITLRQ